MTELIPTRRSQFIHSSRSTRRKEGGCFGECSLTAVRLSCLVRLRRSTAGEWGRRARGTIELADSQRPLTLPRARAPLSQGGGGVAMIPASIPAILMGLCAANGCGYNPSHIEGGALPSANASLPQANANVATILATAGSKGKAQSQPQLVAGVKHIRCAFAKGKAPRPH